MWVSLQPLTQANSFLYSLFINTDHIEISDPCFYVNFPIEFQLFCAKNQGKVQVINGSLFLNIKDYVGLLVEGVILLLFIERDLFCMDHMVLTSLHLVLRSNVE